VKGTKNAGCNMLKDIEPGKRVFVKGTEDYGTMIETRDGICVIQRDNGTVLTANRRDTREMLSHEEITERYPRLVRMMQSTAILSSSEASCGLRDYFRRDIYGGVFGGEAIEHYGGTVKVIQDAIRRRHSFRQFNGGKIGYPRGHSKFSEPYIIETGK
jgi:hypothetical protein